MDNKSKPGKKQLAEGKGCLYVVAVPIGNLGDLSPRARQVLASVALIASESLTATRRLLSAVEIACPRLVSYRDENAAQVEGMLIDHLLGGETAALVCEAGTPAVSDPGWELVKACQLQGISVQAVAGPSSLVAALSIAGVACRVVRFLGFAPHQSKARRDYLKAQLVAPETAVLFESPHRLRDTLSDLSGILGAEQEIVIARELTKLYEETRRGSLAELEEHFAAVSPRGEFVLVIPERIVVEGAADGQELIKKVDFLCASGLSARGTLEFLTQIEGYARNLVYPLITAARKGLREED